MEYNHNLLQLLTKQPETEIPVDSEILSALTADDPRLNSRKIRFCDPPPGKKGKGGLWKDDTGQLHLRDRWGNPFLVRYNGDHDGKVANPEKPGEFIAATYLVYTAGRDMNPATWEDNVTSWRPMTRKWVWFWE